MAATTPPKSKPTPRRPRPASAARGRGSDSEFVYTSPSGVEIRVPSTALLEPDMGAVEDLAEALEQSDNQFAQMSAQMRFIRSALPDEVGQQLRALKMSEFLDFMNSWAAHSGVTPGE